MSWVLTCWILLFIDHEEGVVCKQSTFFLCHHLVYAPSPSCFCARQCCCKAIFLVCSWAFPMWGPCRNHHLQLSGWPVVFSCCYLCQAWGLVPDGCWCCLTILSACPVKRTAFISSNWWKRDVIYQPIDFNVSCKQQGRKSVPESSRVAVHLGSGSSETPEGAYEPCGAVGNLHRWIHFSLSQSFASCDLYAFSHLSVILCLYLSLGRLPPWTWCTKLCSGIRDESTVLPSIPRPVV